MNKYAAMLKIMRAWLSSNKTLTLQGAIEKALLCIAALAKVDLGGPLGMLVINLLEGIIMGNDTHPEVATPDGKTYPSGPAIDPAHAVAIALAAATEIQANPEAAALAKQAATKKA